MSPKRRAGGRARSRDSVVSRLSRKQPHGRRASGAWMQVDTARMRTQDRALAFRLLVSAGFALALLVGILASRQVVERVQGGNVNSAPVLVQSVAVQGNVRLPAATVAVASGVARDSLASGIDTQRIAANLEAHPMIRSATATLLPNGQLVVRIEEHGPVALLRGPATNEAEPVWRLVDAEGTPFAETRADQWSRLPRFHSRRPLETGTSDATLSEALEIAELLGGEQGLQRDAREIELPDESHGFGWVLHSQTLPRRVILGTEDLAPRLQRLALLLDADLEAARGAEEIDLRFADQAVMRSGSSSR